MCEAAHDIEVWLFYTAQHLGRPWSLALKMIVSDASATLPLNQDLTKVALIQ